MILQWWMIPAFITISYWSMFSLWVFIFGVDTPAIILWVIEGIGCCSFWWACYFILRYSLGWIGV